MIDKQPKITANMIHHSSSSLSSDANDDAPLMLIKLSNCSKDSLYKFSQEKCEFCEELFFCSYDMLVHNAKHIIIPLKDELVQCKECSLHFASAMDLDIHTKIHHFKVPDLLRSLIISKPVVQCDNTLTELVIQSNERKLEKIIHKKAVVECDSTVTELIEEKNIENLKDFIIKQPVIRCEDTLKGLVMKNCNMDSGNLKTALINTPTVVFKDTDSEKLKIDLINIPKVVLKNNDFSPNNIKDIKPEDTVNKSMSQENNTQSKINGTSSIKNRLIFEDDESDFEEDILSTNVDGLISDRMTCNQDVCDLTLDNSDDEVERHLKDKILDSKQSKLIPNMTVNSDNNRPLQNKTTDFKQMTGITANSEESFVPAVHYEDLTEPSRRECKICHSTFLNRYDLIVHETRNHLKIRKENLNRKARPCFVCDKYIVGNHWSLKHHIDDRHPNVDTKRNSTLKKCIQCNLKYYKYGKHCENYHYIYKCKLCSKAFDRESLLSEHIPICRGIFQSHLNQDQHRTEMTAADRIGMEKIIKVCELCCLFFKNTQNYKYVLLRDYCEQGKRITCERCEKQFFEVKLIKLINKHPTVQPTYEFIRKNTASGNTNEKRLKNIQQRLKKLKLMNKLR